MSKERYEPIRPIWLDGVNVRDFGAKGDQITDDTAAFEAALAAARKKPKED